MLRHCPFISNTWEGFHHYWFHWIFIETWQKSQDHSIISTQIVTYPEFIYRFESHLTGKDMIWGWSKIITNHKRYLTSSKETIVNYHPFVSQRNQDTTNHNWNTLIHAISMLRFRLGNLLHIFRKQYNQPEVNTSYSFSHSINVVNSNSNIFRLKQNFKSEICICKCPGIFCWRWKIFLIFSAYLVTSSTKRDSVEIN